MGGRWPGLGRIVTVAGEGAWVGLAVGRSVAEVRPPAGAFAVLLVSIDTRRATSRPISIVWPARACCSSPRAPRRPGRFPPMRRLFLSRRPWDRGVVSRGGRVPPGRVMLAERYRDRGYRTGAFTAGGYLNDWWGFGQGFDVYDDGQDLGEACRAGREPELRPIFAEATSYGPERFAVRFDGIELVATPRRTAIDGLVALPLEVFDLAADAGERHPLAAADEAAGAPWIPASWDRAATFVGEGFESPVAAPPPADLAERLRKLGYVE